MVAEGEKASDAGGELFKAVINKNDIPTERMKIVQIGPYPISKDCIRGGVESSVYGLAHALSKQHSVYAIDLPRIGEIDRNEQDEQISVYRFANHTNYNQGAVKRVKDIVDIVCTLSLDVVHIHGTGLISYQLYRAFQKEGVKLMLTVHGLLHVEKTNALKRKFSLKHLYQFVVQSITEFRLLNRAKKIIVDTGYVAEQIRQYHHEHKVCRLPNMHVIPQGINEHFLALKCDRESNVILSVGSISRRKGHLLLLQAFDKVCKQVPNAKMVIAGVLAEQDYYSELQSYIQESPNKANISLLVNLPQEELYELYQRAHIFALHSQEESQGIALVEAMATGLPIVATNVGGIPYVVEDRETGFLADYGDIDGFAKNLITLLNDRKRCNDMSNCAIREAQRYVWRNIASEVVRLYIKILP